MVVIDASALIEVLLNAESFPRLTEIVLGHELHAPYLIDIEVVHSFRHAVLGERLAPSRAVTALEDLAALRIIRHAHEPLLQRIFALRHNQTAYDASYVALAESLNLPLITRDRGLAKSSAHAARIEYVE